MSSDPINPKHYKHLPVEAIDIIMAAIAKAPSNESAYLQGQVLKYLLRCWSKKGIEDLRKAKWYLDRLVNQFDEVLAEASGASETPSDEPSEDRPPAGWRKMEIGEKIELSDMFWFEGNCTHYKEPCFRYEKLLSFHVTHIRKIAPTKRYREPTQADLRGGAIECEYRDNDDEQWRSGLLVYILSGSMSFLCTNKEEQLSGQWAQCRIEVAE